MTTKARSIERIMQTRRDMTHAFATARSGPLLAAHLTMTQLKVLLVLFRAVVAAGQGEDQRIAALKLAERTHRAGVIRERVIREGAARSDVRTHTTHRPPRLRESRPGATDKA